MPAQFWEANLTSPGYTADGAALASSLALTDVSPTPNLILPANYLYPGQTLRVTAAGRFSTTGAPTLLMGVYYGAVAGTALCTTGAIVTPSGVTNMVWNFSALIVCRTVGSAGTVMAIGDLRWGLTAITAAVAGTAPGSAPATATIDTTASKALTLGAQWGTSSSSNTLTCHLFTVEATN